MEWLGPECAWTLTTAPTIEPFTIQDAKDQIRSVQDRENGLVDQYITAARTVAEEHLGRGLLTQTWTLNLSDFVAVISLPMAAPLQSVTHVKYYDVNGTQQTLATSVYDVDTNSRPGRVALKAGQSWPALQGTRKVTRIEIQYVVGWTSPDLIPGSIRQGMRMWIALLDTNRDALDVGTTAAMDIIKAAFWTDRIFWAPPQYGDGY